MSCSCSYRLHSTAYEYSHLDESGYRRIASGVLERADDSRS